VETGNLQFRKTNSVCLGQEEAVLKRLLNLWAARPKAAWIFDINPVLSEWNIFYASRCFGALVNSLVRKGIYESDDGREWEGPLEITNRAAIRFGLGDGSKRENGDGFQSQSRFR